MTITPEVQTLIDAIRSGKCATLDGIMSPLTQRLLLKHKADGVDMTEYWIRTPQNWTCPGCGRNKESIVRKNAHNLLMCKLVSHHDHMKDLLLERFRSISASLKQVVADEVAERFAKRAVSMVASYDNTLICQDCNTVDSQAKKLVGTHNRFSYSPSEIRQFVIKHDNAPHSIDEPIAKEIWKSNEATFALRLKIVDRIAEIAATNRHWYQEVHFSLHPDNVYRTSNAEMLYYFNVHTLPYHLLGGGTKTVRDYSSWRLKPLTVAKEIPSNGDCDHAAKVTSSRDWGLVGDDWSCPVCNRSKIEIVRKNNKNEWSFNLANKLYRNEDKPYRTERKIICNDCGLVAISVGEESAKRVGSATSRFSAWVSLDSIATIIKPRPHNRHEINSELAKVIVDTVANIIKCEANE